jgi:uncharacterized membrane protein YdbT with pleckstrin-like domain
MSAEKEAAPAPVADQQPSPGSGQPERDVWSGRYSVRAMGGWIILLGVMGIAFLYVFLKYERPVWIGWAMLITFIGCGVWLVLVGLSRKLVTRYRLTTQRLFVDKGFISRKVDEVELKRVDDVSVQQNIVQRMFNVGDVKVMAPTDPSSPTISVVGICNPIEVKEKIRGLTQELRKKSLRMEAI